MASEKWSNPTVCLVPMSWPTEYAWHLDVRTTSIYPLPKMSPDRALALSEIFALPANSTTGARRTVSGARLPRCETRLLPTLACKSERNRYFARSSSPNQVRPPVVERLGDVLGCYLLVASEVGDGPCHPEYPVMPPPRKPHPVHSPREERLRIAPQSTHLAQPASGERGVGGALAPLLDLTRPTNPLPYEPGLFGLSLFAQLLAREARHIDEEVHAIEQRPGDAALVAFDLANRTPAAPPSVSSVAAGTRVHGTQ